MMFLGFAPHLIHPYHLASQYANCKDMMVRYHTWARLYFFSFQFNSVSDSFLTQLSQWLLEFDSNRLNIQVAFQNSDSNRLTTKQVFWNVDSNQLMIAITL